MNGSQWLLTPDKSGFHAAWLLLSALWQSSILLAAAVVAYAVTAGGLLALVAVGRHRIGPGGNRLRRRRARRHGRADLLRQDARPPGRTPAPADRFEQKTYRLPKGRWLRGVLLDKATGKPLANAPITSGLIRRPACRNGLTSLLLGP